MDYSFPASQEGDPVVADADDDMVESMGPCQKAFMNKFVGRCVGMMLHTVIKLSVQNAQNHVA